MKKTFFVLTALLLGGSLSFGYDTEPRNDLAYPQAEHVTVAPEHTSGLTPKRPQTGVVRAQASVTQPALSTPYIPPASEPMLFAEAPIRVETVAFAEQTAPANSGGDGFAALYAEMERMNDEIQKIKKDTAKPDTKKAWSPIKMNGRIFIDSVNFADQNGTNMPNAAGFRELRLGATGNGFSSFDYKVEFGFQNSTGQVSLIDNWIGAKNVPLLGYLRVGHFKPETGLDYPMGSTNISMMEYITSANTFGLGRKIGISSEHLFANDRIRLFFGVFQGGSTDTSRRLLEDNQGQVVNLRLTAAPYFAEEGKYVFHVGGHWEYESLDTGAAHMRTLSAKPGTFSWASNSLSASNFVNDYSHRGGLEFAWQYERYSVRSELFAGSFSGGEHLYGTYIELGYFLTNDFRSYNLASGAFGAVKTKSNFHPFKCGEWNLVDSLGAWQAIFQWSYTDMDDWRAKDPNAGHQNDFVLGLNWYWTPQLRWIFEYVRSEQCLGSIYTHKSQDIFGTSLRVSF